MADAGRSEGNPMVQGAHMDDEPCPACGSGDVMTIEMRVGDDPLSVRYCAKCETREWSRAGASVDLDYLLPAMRATTRKRA